MRHLLRSCATVWAATLLGGCASALPEPPVPAAPAAARGDARTITSADLANATQLSLLDYVRAERPQWFRRPDGRPASLTIYIDDAPAGGGVSALRDITLARVALVRYYDITAAQQRYNSRISTPVIAVTSR